MWPHFLETQRVLRFCWKLCTPFLDLRTEDYLQAATESHINTYFFLENGCQIVKPVCLDLQSTKDLQKQRQFDPPSSLPSFFPAYLLEGQVSSAVSNAKIKLVLLASVKAMLLSNSKWKLSRVCCCSKEHPPWKHCEGMICIILKKQPTFEDRILGKMDHISALEQQSQCSQRSVFPPVFWRLIYAVWHVVFAEEDTTQYGSLFQTHILQQLSALPIRGSWITESSEDHLWHKKTASHCVCEDRFPVLQLAKAVHVWERFWW